MSEAPLITLLSWAWIAHTIEVDNAVEAAGASRPAGRFQISLPMWANGLRCIPETGVTIRELRESSRAGCNLGGLERWGWIRVATSGRARRDGYGTRRGLKPDTVVCPTEAGSIARRLFPEIVATVEERWRKRFGQQVIEALRTQLGAPLSGIPWSPPEVYPTDGFCTHIVTGAGDLGELPLVALLGQALTAQTVGQERTARVSLPLAANLLRVIDGEDVPLRELPARTGLSREAVRMATSYLARKGFATLDSGRVIRLLATGAEALDAYRSRAFAEDDHALRSALGAVLDQTEALAAGLAPPDGSWRQRRPYLAQTRRLLADPTSALPWHPMVLHRGGWPDGS